MQGGTRQRTTVKRRLYEHRLYKLFEFRRRLSELISYSTKFSLLG